MQQQLTTEEKAKVFALYLGCQVNLMGEWKDDYADKKVAKVFTLNGVVNDNDANVFCHCDDIHYHHEVVPDECFLLLTDLRNISDEDAVEVGKILISHHASYHISNPDWLIENTKYWIKNGLVAVYSSSAYQNLTAFQYLISMGYAVPLFFGINNWANGKTAIELQIAIDKQTLKQ